MATSKFGKAFAAARKEKGAGKTFTFEGKSYSTDLASDKSSAPTSSSRPTARPTRKAPPMKGRPDTAKRVSDATTVDRRWADANATPKAETAKPKVEVKTPTSSTTRPQSRPTGTRPQSRPTATTPVAKSASVPSVTTTPLAPNTLKGYTWDQYIKGNNLGRLRAGVPMDIRSEEDFLKKAAEEEAAKNAPKAPSSVATRRSNRNYNKGGMVNKSNCGASVPPSKKR